MTKAEKLAIDILNKMHMEHGLQDVMKCKFCTSLRAERILSEALAPLLSASEERDRFRKDSENWRNTAYMMLNVEYEERKRLLDLASSNDK